MPIYGVCVCMCGGRGGINSYLLMLVLKGRMGEAEGGGGECYQGWGRSAF